MKKILLILTILSSIVYSQSIKNISEVNPKVYAALGDVIYNNVSKIEKLKEMKIYEVLNEEIDIYTLKVSDLKKEGFLLEGGDKSIDKKLYLNTLRELSKYNDQYIRSAKSNFRDAVKNEDSETFEKIINTGLIDTQRHKDKIINYYFAHQEDVNASGVIQGYLDADAKLRAEREAKRKYYKTKKQLEEEKIKRIRKTDKEEQAKLEKQLEDEVIKKKEEIIKEQKSELFN